VAVTGVVPFGKVLPDWTLVVTLTGPQLSLALRPVKLTTAEQEPGSFPTTMSGALSVGAVWSTTVTTCVAVAVLPDVSVTFHVTVVAPSGNEDGALLVTEG